MAKDDMTIDASIITDADNNDLNNNLQTFNSNTSNIQSNSIKVENKSIQYNQNINQPETINNNDIPLPITNENNLVNEQNNIGITQINDVSNNIDMNQINSNLNNMNQINYINNNVGVTPPGSIDPSIYNQNINQPAAQTMPDDGQTIYQQQIMAMGNINPNNQEQPQQALQPNLENIIPTTKTRFNYVVQTPQGQKIKGSMDANTQDEVVNYLTAEGNQVIKIKATGGSKSILNLSIGGDKIKYADLAFILTQLSTYLKAGISLIDSVKILEKQSVKPEQRRVFGNIVLELTKGESFSNAISAQGNAFPKLLANMVKTAEMTGDLPSILDDMTDYYTTIDRTRKQVISAMTYPMFMGIFALVVVTFMLVYIIPQFVGLFEQNNAELPAITKVVIAASDFLTGNAVPVIIALIGIILVYSLCFKYIRPFRKTMQTIFMKIPVVGNVLIYKEVAMFTKTFASLLNHNVFITDSMAILSTISNNEIYKEIIDDSLEYLSKGAKISDSFKGKWAFPIVAYEMLVTGETTGRLPMMMDYVARYYDDLHSNAVKRINTFIEPVMIISLALVVGVVVLSIIIPMFSFYSQIA